MAIVFTDSQNYTDIASAIRLKLGVATTYKPSEMASAILSISGGGGTVNNQDKTVSPSISLQSVTFDSGYTGLGTVTINAVTSAIDNNIQSGNIKLGTTILGVTGTYSGTVPTGTLTISSNGTFDVASYASASVAVPDPAYMKKYTDPANFTTFTDDELSGTIQYGAFAYTSKLATVSFANATSVGNYAFGYCFALRTISFPKVKTISTYAFQYCSSFNWDLDSTKFPSLVGTVAGYAFRGCQYLTGVSLPSVTSIGAQTFSACSRISYVDLPKVTHTAAGAFSYLTTCTDYSLPVLQVIGSSAFYSNWALTTLTLPAVTTISAYAFRYCSTLMSIYFTGSTVPTLASTAFANMPMSVSVNNVYGSIYVPSSLVATYKAATNWKTYSARIVAITE